MWPYSGRDIDLFPHIRKTCLKPTIKPPFWINQFTGDPSDEASRECCAIRIDLYPSDVLKDLGVSYAQQLSRPDLGTMLNALTDELKDKLSFTTETQQLIYGLLLTRLGYHEDSYSLLKQLYDDKPIAFPSKQYALLSITYARLNHEVGHYEDTHRVAREALAWSKSLRDKDLQLNTSIQAHCWKSEALCMYVPPGVAMAFGLKAIEDGYRALFTNAAAVIAMLTRALRHCTGDGEFLMPTTGEIECCLTALLDLTQHYRCILPIGPRPRARSNALSEPRSSLNPLGDGISGLLSYHASGPLLADTRTGMRMC